MAIFSSRDEQWTVLSAYRFITNIYTQILIIQTQVKPSWIALSASLNNILSTTSTQFFLTISSTKVVPGWFLVHVLRFSTNKCPYFPCDVGNSRNYKQPGFVLIHFDVWNYSTERNVTYLSPLTAFTGGKFIIIIIIIKTFINESAY